MDQSRGAGRRHSRVHDFSDCLIAVLGYFDESGTGLKDKVLVVGGYLARAEQWAQFSREWRQILLTAGIDPPITLFHRTEFEARNNPRMRGLKP